MSASLILPIQGVPDELIRILNDRFREVGGGANIGTAGIYTKVTTDAEGRVISGTALVATDLPGGGYPATPITSQNVVTGTRALATAYQNPSATLPMFVMVTLAMFGSAAMVGTVLTGAANPPGTTIANTSNSSTVVQVNVPLSFWVLPGWWYRVNGSAGVTVSIWTEWR